MDSERYALHSGRRVALAVLVLAAMTTGGACASGRKAGTSTVAADSTISPSRRPNRGCEAEEWMPPSVLKGVRLDVGMPCFVRPAVIEGLETAVSTLQREDDCRAMFSELGADGIQVIADALYVVADARAEKKICKNAVAFTTVGGQWTGICRRFANLGPLEAAAVILHEALHQAGLGEQPLDRSGDRSLDITLKVSRRCGLGTRR